MSKERSPFRNAADKTGRQLEKTRKAFDIVQALANQNLMTEAYNSAFDFATECEKLTILARSLPSYSGHPGSAARMESTMLQAVPVKMRFTKEGWFKLRIPALLPRKEHGSPEYIRGFLYPAMKRFFNDKQRIRFDDCVIIFKHIYDSTRPERQYRDHDNIEINAVVDVIASFLLDGDGPLRCFHFYMSAAGKEDSTEIIVLEQSDFARFLYGEKVIKNEVKPTHERPP